MLHGLSCKCLLLISAPYFDVLVPCIYMLQGLHTTLGTPTTLQIGARPFNESTLIQIAYAYEQMTMHREPPQLFPECVNPVVATTTNTAATGTATAG